MFSLKFIAATKEYSSFEKHVPAPYLRKSFDWAGGSASVTVCGLGFYELYINGKNVTKGPLAPYISNPDDILYYDKYDVTEHLVPGENVIGLVLGNGMLNCPGGQIWDFEQARYRSAPKAALSFESDSLCFEADESFRCAPSPIMYDELRVGEFYDARNEIPGWNRPGFDDSAWTPAIPAETPRGECRFCGAEPIVVVKELTPVNVTRGKYGPTPRFRENLPVIDPEGVEAETEGWLYDFGVNTAGVPRLKITGNPGQKIVIQFCEKLLENEEGTLDLRAMNFLPKALNHRMIYICKGGEEEIHVPRFTYYGFRYALVFGLEDAQATPELLSFLVMNSDIRVNAGFECSDETLSRLYQCAQVSNFANFYYFPTDCPHREKNGWTGDAQLSAEQMLINMTPENSYREWLNNIRKAQRIDGALPGIIPTCGWGFDWGNGPAYDAVITTLPYMMWKYRGDTEIIRENAEAIMRYLHYILTRRDENGLIHIGLGDWCHAGLTGDPLAPLEVTDMAMCLDISSKAAEMFAAIGMTAEAAYAKTVFDTFRTAGRKHLIDFETMTVRGRCQSSQALAIYHDLFDESEKQAAFDVLVQLVKEKDGLLDVGILGNRALYTTLSRFGRTDLAYEMITTDRFPGFGNWIARGATSLWETFRPENVQADSLNHHMWADITRWMIENIAGLRIHPDGLNTVEIAPQFIDNVTHASAWHNAPAGRMSLRWKRDGETIRLTLSLPECVKGSIVVGEEWKFEDGCGCIEAKTGEYRIRRK